MQNVTFGGCQLDTDDSKSDAGEYEPLTEDQITGRMKEIKESWAKGIPVRVRPRWHTPKALIDAVKELMGGIDVDPASCESAQKRIQAKRYYTQEDDGFKFNWYGKLFLNPDYTDEYKWFSKAVSEYRCGNVTEGIILTHTIRTYEEWFYLMCSASSAICLMRGEIKWAVDHALDVAAVERCGEDFHPKYDRHGNIVFYFGQNVKEFKRIFSNFGVCYGK